MDSCYGLVIEEFHNDDCRRDVKEFSRYFKRLAMDCQDIKPTDININSIVDTALNKSGLESSVMAQDVRHVFGRLFMDLYEFIVAEQSIEKLEHVNIRKPSYKIVHDDDEIDISDDSIEPGDRSIYLEDGDGTSELGSGCSCDSVFESVVSCVLSTTFTSTQRSQGALERCERCSRKSEIAMSSRTRPEKKTMNRSSLPDYSHIKHVVPSHIIPRPKKAIANKVSSLLRR